MKYSAVVCKQDDLGILLLSIGELEKMQKVSEEYRRILDDPESIKLVNITNEEYIQLESDQSLADEILKDRL